MMLFHSYSFALLLCAAVSSEVPGHGAKKTAAIPATKCTPKKVNLWPHNTVPYNIPEEFNGTEAAIIRQAMNMITSQTGKCVKFVKRNEHDNAHYVLFSKSDSSLSTIGFDADSDQQYVTLQQPSFDKYTDDKGIGNILHELMHTLGFRHELARWDRDDYIDVNWNNIRADVKNQFEKACFQTFGLPYDYQSVLHYASHNVFAKNKAYPTFISKKSPKLVEWSFHLSPLDVKKIQLLYKCPFAGKGVKGKP